jgi:hypothetical protein
MSEHILRTVYKHHMPGHFDAIMEASQSAVLTTKSVPRMSPERVNRA